MTRAPAIAPASSSSSSPPKLRGGSTLVRVHGRANERQEPWLLIFKSADELRAPGVPSTASSTSCPTRLVGHPPCSRLRGEACGEKGPQARSEERAAKATPVRCQPAPSARSCPLLAPQLATLVERAPPATTGSTRSSSTAIACSRASMAMTFGCSRERQRLDLEDEESGRGRQGAGLTRAGRRRDRRYRRPRRARLQRLAERLRFGSNRKDPVLPFRHPLLRRATICAPSRDRAARAALHASRRTGTGAHPLQRGLQGQCQGASSKTPAGCAWKASSASVPTRRTSPGARPTGSS